MEILIIEVTVGYMLKVLKSGKLIGAYKKEFASIRHGNYYDFITLIGEPIPFMITYNHGIIRTETEARKDDIDFAGLVKAGPSLKVFYEKCKDQYGEIQDLDLPDKVYRNLVLFEIGMRMHANNNSLLTERENLETVITKISEFKSLPHRDKETLQKGRKFLNMVKHNNNQFRSWNEGLVEFEKAFELLTKYKMTIVGTQRP